jgi:nicotinamide mononucleotide (NMN) deamidase PncC
VFVGVAGPEVVDVRELHLYGDRERVRQRAATIALHMLREAVTA